MRKVIDHSKDPQHGDSRVVRRFLFIPTTLSNKDGTEEVERWLEWASISQLYNSYDGISYDVWEDLRWDDI